MEKQLTPDQWQQFNMLQDVVTHFSENPEERRSVQNNGQCRYSPPFNKPLSCGCAIGMYLKNDICESFDGSGSIDDVLRSSKVEIAPKWLKEMDVDFLIEIQDLHDSKDCWLPDNISKRGIETVKDICNSFKLPFDKIKFK